MTAVPRLAVVEGKLGKPAAAPVTQPPGGGTGPVTPLSTIETLSQYGNAAKYERVDLFYSGTISDGSGITPQGLTVDPVAGTLYIGGDGNAATTSTQGRVIGWDLPTALTATKAALVRPAKKYDSLAVDRLNHCQEISWDPKRKCVWAATGEQPELAAADTGVAQFDPVAKTVLRTWPVPNLNNGAVVTYDPDDDALWLLTGGTGTTKLLRRMNPDTGAMTTIGNLVMPNVTTPKGAVRSSQLQGMVTYGPLVFALCHYFGDSSADSSNSTKTATPHDRQGRLNIFRKTGGSIVHSVVMPVSEEVEGCDVIRTGPNAGRFVFALHWDNRACELRVRP